MHNFCYVHVLKIGDHKPQTILQSYYNLHATDSLIHICVRRHHEPFHLVILKTIFVMNSHMHHSLLLLNEKQTCVVRLSTSAHLQNTQYNVIIFLLLQLHHYVDRDKFKSTILPDMRQQKLYVN